MEIDPPGRDAVEKPETLALGAIAGSPLRRLERAARYVGQNTCVTLNVLLHLPDGSDLHVPCIEGVTTARDILNVAVYHAPELEGRELRLVHNYAKLPEAAYASEHFSDLATAEVEVRKRTPVPVAGDETVPNLDVESVGEPPHQICSARLISPSRTKARLLLAVAEMRTAGLITVEQKRTLKHLVLTGHPSLVPAAEAFSDVPPGSAESAGRTAQAALQRVLLSNSAAYDAAAAAAASVADVATSGPVSFSAPLSFSRHKLTSKQEGAGEESVPGSARRDELPLQRVDCLEGTHDNANDACMTLRTSFSPPPLASISSPVRRMRSTPCDGSDVESTQDALPCYSPHFERMLRDAAASVSLEPGVPLPRPIRREVMQAN